MTSFDDHATHLALYRRLFVDVVIDELERDCRDAERVFLFDRLDLVFDGPMTGLTGLTALVDAEDFTPRWKLA